LTRSLAVRALVVFALGALSLPGLAFGATARFDAKAGRLLYQAAPGEANAVVIAYGEPAEDESSVKVTIRETGAAIQPGTSCTPTNPNEVVCTIDLTVVDPFHFVDIRLSDGNDSFSAATQCRSWDCGLVVYGGPGADALTGSEARDELYGGQGADRLDGRAGYLSLTEDVGDWLDGEAGADVLYGGADEDSLHGGPGPDVLQGGTGLDTAVYWDRRVPIRADLDGAADDGARGERDRIATDVEAIAGGDRGDRLLGNGRVNVLEGGAGNDLLEGRGGPDQLIGGAGSDVLRGGAGRDFMIAGPAYYRFGWEWGDERGPGFDLLLGGPGNDQLIAEDGNRDDVRGGRGRDVARVDRGLDELSGIERLELSNLTG
jgi:hypothetical protein